MTTKTFEELLDDGFIPLKTIPLSMLKVEGNLAIQYIKQNKGVLFIQAYYGESKYLNIKGRGVLK